MSTGRDVFKNLRVVYTDYIESEKGSSFSMNFIHNFTLISYILDGAGVLEIDKSQISFLKDDFLMLPPNTLHTVRCSEGFKCILIGIGGDVSFRGMREENTFKKTSKVFIENFSDSDFEFTRILCNIHKESENKYPLYHEYTDLLSSLLILNVIRFSKNNLELKLNYEKKKSVEFIKSYIDDNFFEDITLDSLAYKFSMNKFTLLRTFKKKYGLTPIDYLQKRRIDECKKLLNNDSLSISEISESSGFSSQSYFNQVFKKLTGISPSLYRKNSKNK